MPTNSVVQHTNNKNRLLRDFYNQLTRVEFANPTRAFGLLDELLENIEEVTGPPDIWHNAGMIASRLNYPRRVQIIRAGLSEWPNDVDLLCDDLQFCYGSDYDHERAQEIWSALESMDLSKTGPFWRFWVYGAIYHARIGRVQDGLDLLDRGVFAVKRDSLMDVFRGYRNVLVDHVPQRALASEKELVDLHNEILEILEAKLSLGIRLGIENGYVLALELARLYQEKAGTDFFDHEAIGATVGETQSRVNENLRRALEILHLAECLYTANPVHPIQDIYERRINILMALHEYDEALKLLNSLPSTQHRLEEQRIARETMRRFAMLKTGGSLEDLETRETQREAAMEDSLQSTLQMLFSNNGEALESLARSNPSVKQIILAIASEFSFLKE